MNKRITAAVLVISALMLATGAFLLFNNSTEEPSPTYRKTVQAPPEKTPEAPDWVNKGQEAQPDYSTAEAEAHNATPPQEDKPTTEVVEITENSVVTFTFVESLTDFFLDRFQPVGPNGIPVTKASAKSLNMLYGREMTGFAVEGDTIRKARQNLLDYAFTPKMIRTLRELYTPLLLNDLVERSQNTARDYTVGVETEHRTLSTEEIQTMLRLNAEEMEKVAAVFQKIAETPSVTTLAGKYIQASKAVDRANGLLQTAISDGKDTALAGKRLKQAILQREEEKKAIISILQDVCTKCSANEVFYLAQWSYRRIMGESEGKRESFDAASTALRTLAQDFRQAADSL